MKPDDFKSLIKEIGGLIDARAKTTEIVIKAHVSSEVKASEERTKEELRAEILAARAEAKADNLHLCGKIDKVIKQHDKRIDALEEAEGISNPYKH